MAEWAASGSRAATNGTDGDVMGAVGFTTVNFGSFPGQSNVSVAVTGQTGILSGSFVEAWLYPTTTGDHLADEHVVDGPVTSAGNISVGVGFTIYLTARDGIPVPPGAGAAPMPYGQWTVAWCWN